MAQARVAAEQAWPEPQVGVEHWGFSRSGLNAHVERSKVQNRAITSRQELETAQAKLNALLARGPDEPILANEEPVAASTEPAQQQLESLALEYRPEVHGAAHHVDHMRAE